MILGGRILGGAILAADPVEGRALGAPDVVVPAGPPGDITLSRTFGAMTVAATATISITASLAASFGAMTVASNATQSQVLTIYPSNFVRAPAAVNEGHGGSTHRNWFTLINASGTLRHFFHTHNDGSTGGGVATGVDPQPYESSLSGSTGTAIALPAGYVSASDRAALIVTALDADAAVATVTQAASGNADGSWNIAVTMVAGATLTLGTRAAASRGAAGVFGSRAFRRALTAEITGAADGAITRNIAQLLSAYPPSTARITAVSMVLGATVSTTAANVPRMYLRSGDTSTTVPGPTMLFDFGQFPVSEIVAGRRATIYLTTTQSAALRTALTGATGRLWLCTKASATTQNNALPTGGPWEGDFDDANIRVDVVTSGAGNTAAPATWNNAGATSVAVIVSMALHYEVDPATQGEAYPRDTLADITAAPNTVTLPNTVTAQTHALITGHRGAHLHQLRANLIDSGCRYCIKGSTDATDITADPDDPDLTGATTLHDFGQQTSGTGVVMTAPTGSSSVILPEVVVIEFKGNGLQGRGWTTPSAITPTVADDAIYAGGGVGSVDGTSQHELDYAGESGDPTTGFTTPTTGATTQPLNRPGCELTYRRSADYITTP